MNDDLALLIGVGHYPKSKGILKDVRSYHEDIIRVQEWLLKPDGGNLSPQNCRIIESDKDGERLFSLIDDYFDNLIDEFDVSQIVKRRFYFYFTGHGFGKEYDDTMLILPGWSRARPNAAISSREYLSMIWSIGMFKEIVMWLDCCRTKRIQVNARTPTGARTSTKKPSKTFVGLGTHFDNEAYWVSVEDQEDKYTSIYTQVLVNGLLDETVIDTLDLAAFLDRQVPLLAQQHKLIQHPDHYHYSVAKKDIVFK